MRKLHATRNTAAALASRAHRAHNRRMQVVKTYSTRTEADLARIVLDAAGIEAQVVGVGVAMEGGVASVRLLVPDEQAQAALEVLRDS